MEWAMAELVTHPRTMRRAQDEVRTATAGSTGVNEDHVAQLDDLKAMVKETLRLHAPVLLLVPREPRADAEILGYHVPACTRVLVNAWAIGRDPATWERAEDFVPGRFMDGGTAATSVDFRGQHFELRTFGAGRRVCLGMGFAEASAEMALASLLYHFDWEVAGGGVLGSRNREGTPTPSLDMTEMNGIAVHIKSGLPLLAKPWVP
ncbi:unnamed protein product [Miscanthus lutarioriparius]|uniref:Cytochrome P450 n=1 Tax=Miscanthus lutarioriparius TaxID=422564 RepID=A0A811P4Z9_9POAL|nr:unnamed protein product [Miscanthus lutarioriparius]